MNRLARRVARSARDTRPMKPRSGQSVTEFAVILPVFFLILGGMMQFGIIFWGQSTLTQIARDTGRWAATQSGCTEGTVAPAVNVLAKAKQLAASSDLVGPSAGWTSPANVQVSWSGAPCPPLTNADRSYVTITLHHRVPVFFPFIPGDGNLSTTAEFRMEPQAP